MFASMVTYPGLFGDFDRLRRELDELSGWSGLPTSIRSAAPGAFPAINIGNTATSVEIYAFAPGIDPKQIELTIDRGVLSISASACRDCPLKTARSISTAMSALPASFGARSACPKTLTRQR